MTQSNCLSTKIQFIKCSVNQKDITEGNIKTDADVNNGSIMQDQTQSEIDDMDRIEFDPTSKYLFVY